MYIGSGPKMIHGKSSMCDCIIECVKCTKCDNGEVAGYPVKPACCSSPFLGRRVGGIGDNWSGMWCKSLWMNGRQYFSLWRMDVRLNKLRSVCMLTMFSSMSLPSKGAGLI
jgi:hypothetical protein